MLLLLLLLLLILFCFEGISQVGGRKIEKSYKVAGKRRTIGKSKPAWIYRKTESGPVQDREMPKLFRRKRTKPGEENEKILKRQNKLRAKRRVRGNNVFHKRKYF
jgi:hypothetical protein